MVKKYYFNIKTPSGVVKTYSGETKHEAIQTAVAADGYKYSNSQYIAKKCK